MNIKDYSEREVICISNQDNNFFSCDVNSPMLEVGATYTVVNLYVYGWYTEVELKEFPGVVFNSVCFKEIDEKGDVE